MRRSSGQRAIEIALFLTLFLAYGYFNQGGGWNQNGRFDQVRAIVETGRLFINGYASYQLRVDAGGRGDLLRRPMPDHYFGRRYQLNTGDWSYNAAEGRYYPNKPPGTSFLAVPGYWLVYHVERFASIDMDNLWPLIVNVFITTALSVGLLAAMGGVIFLRLSRCLFPDCRMVNHVASALTLGLGTMVFPFSTILVDHVPVAVFLMLSFYLMACEGAGVVAFPPARWRPLLAGASAGAAVLCNYAAMLGVLVLAAYASRVYQPRTQLPLFFAGCAMLAAALAWYHHACFGSVVINANTYQNQRFVDHGDARLFGMVSLPDLGVAWQLLVGPRRGLLFTSPVLALSAVGLWIMAARYRLRAEALLCAAMFATYVLFNASFNAWHGGDTFGPRYLIPMLPFAALPLAPVYAQLRWIAALPAAFSAAMMLLATIVTPLPPQAIENPVWHFLVPIAFGLPRDSHPELDRFKGPVSASPNDVHGLRGLDEKWNSFNLGELFWPQRWVSILPLAACVAAGVVVLILLSRREDEANRPPALQPSRG